MFAIWFIVGLISCLPATVASEFLALNIGWDSATRSESATRWLLMSGAAIIAIAFIVVFAPLTRGKREAGYGLILGAIVGSVAICVLHLSGP
jgi:hypothetical protein